MIAPRPLGIAALALSLGTVAWTGEIPAARSAALRVERTAYLMGTRAWLATREGDRERGLRVLESMLEELEAVEAELSTWREESALSAINRQPIGAPAPAADRMCALLRELATWHEATGGAFDPGVGRLVEAWDLRGAGRRPPPAALRGARSNSGLAHLELRSAPCRVTRTRNVLLDAGAFGKGAALDRAARGRTQPDHPSWMIDLGGQVAVHAPLDAPWSVALAHPGRRDQAVMRLDLTEGSLATSGGSERDVRLGDGALGHVLDPRTGEPVSRAGSVTVWHRRALVADVLSTALYVMGPARGHEWAEAHGIAACFLEPDGNGPAAIAHVTTAFEQRFPEAERVDLSGA